MVSGERCAAEGKVEIKENRKDSERKTVALLLAGKAI